MPETIPALIQPIPPPRGPELLSADTGALVQRELMERSGLIDAGRLHDPRHPSSIRYPLSDLLRTRLLLLGQTSPTPTACVKSLRVASQTRRGTAALEEGQGLASQPTLSRLLDTLSREDNLPVTRRCGAGVPSEDDRRSAAKTGEKDPTEEETEKDDGGRGRSRSRSMGIPREANGTDTIASGCTTGWWLVPRRGTWKIYPGASYLGSRR